MKTKSTEQTTDQKAQQTKGQKWISHYSKKILKHWQSMKSPFQVSQQYIQEIQTQLSSFYDIPEERLFIELSY